VFSIHVLNYIAVVELRINASSSIFNQTNNNLYKKISKETDIIMLVIVIRDHIE